MAEEGMGVTYAKGFKAAGIHAGIRKNKTKRDLSLILSEVVGSAAGVYTTNLVKGAPLIVTKQNISDGKAQAIVCNSGNANTCNANGIEIANGMCRLVAEHTGVSPKDVIVASTGVIGQPLSLEPIQNAMGDLAAVLSVEGHKDAAEGIMTTDTVRKEVKEDFILSGVPCRIGGMAKGSGMIHPNMATMLVFLTTDAAIEAKLLQKALTATVEDTFNMISVDGDTSTNDMVNIIANGMANNPMVTEEGEDYQAFSAALKKVMVTLCKMLAKDGEGATKLLICTVDGAKDKQCAKTVAKSVICSSLLKAAMFGADANWGRVLCAAGYSGANFDPAETDVDFYSSKGKITVCRQGAGVDFSEEKAKEILSEDEIGILINLHSGTQTATAYGCDLTYEYVKINGDYRT